jgi:snurportin-1
MPFQRDGILLLNKEGQYHLGSSPLALLWKDAQCSRFFLDTDAEGAVPQWQHVTLQYLTSGQVATGDHPPIVLAAATPLELDKHKAGLLR